MNTGNENQSVAIGATLSLVFHAEGQPHFLTCTVTQNGPLTLEGPSTENIKKGMKLLLISQVCGEIAKAACECLSISQIGSKQRIVLGQLQWEASDRRRYPRYSISAHINLRGVVDEGQTAEIVSFDGNTVDLSLGGAWVSTEAPFSPGSLVQVETQISSKEVIRALGVVSWKHSDTSGFGVEFLDFVGASRYHLHEFLSRQAA